MSLSTGHLINRNPATPLPMPAEVMDTIERLVASQEAKPGLAFTNRDNRILFFKFEDDNEEDEYSFCKSEEEDLEYNDGIGKDELDHKPLAGDQDNL